MTDAQKNAQDLYLWLRTSPLDFLVLDMEGATKRGTVKVMFDLIYPNVPTNPPLPSDFLDLLEKRKER